MDTLFQPGPVADVIIDVCVDARFFAFLSLELALIGGFADFGAIVGRFFVEVKVIPLIELFDLFPFCRTNEYDLSKDDLDLLKNGPLLLLGLLLGLLLDVSAEMMSF